MIRHVVWDWNGTLLDDVDVCVATLNSLVTERNLVPLSRDTYRRAFGFPVRAFYEELGFDVSPPSWGELSVRFYERYCARADEHRLSAGASEVLASLAARGLVQHVVSAMEERLLARMLVTHGVRPYLRGVRGLTTLAASSKVTVGMAMMAAEGLRPHEVLFVGDTLHDHETARAMGVRCVLYAGGHQARERLEAAGVPVIDELADVERHLD